MPRRSKKKVRPKAKKKRRPRTRKPRTGKRRRKPVWKKKTRRTSRRPGRARRRTPKRRKARKKKKAGKIRRPKRRRGAAPRRKTARRKSRRALRRKKAKRRARARRRPFIRNWAKMPKERLLDLRICDLNLRLEGSQLRPCIRRLYRELKARGFAFRPHFWLSGEWFTPDGVGGVAIPFYLAHPRLRGLEREFMLEVEGGNEEWCMKLLRHETAHAMLNAYQLHRRRDWQQCFGRSSEKYPDTYLPKPYSKRFVIHLENWYAQAHPHEDWAETFAVWLKPNSDWRRRYKGWPALKKLEYVDQLMTEIRGQRPRRRSRRPVEPVTGMRQTLREYYADKQERYAADSPEFFDRDLKALFSDAPEHRHNEKAWHYIRRVREEVIAIVGRWTHEYDYRISEVLKDMTERCRELDLRVGRDDATMRDEIVACLTVLVMNKLHSGGFHISL
jgi:hypothetical protein